MANDHRAITHTEAPEEVLPLDLLNSKLPMEDAHQYADHQDRCGRELVHVTSPSHRFAATLQWRKLRNLLLSSRSSRRPPRTVRSVTSTTTFPSGTTLTT